MTARARRVALEHLHGTADRHALPVEGTQSHPSRALDNVASTNPVVEAYLGLLGSNALERRAADLQREGCTAAQIVDRLHAAVPPGTALRLGKALGARGDDEQIYAGATAIVELAVERCTAWRTAS